MQRMTIKQGVTDGGAFLPMRLTGCVAVRVHGASSAGCVAESQAGLWAKIKPMISGILLFTLMVCQIVQLFRAVADKGLMTRFRACQAVFQLPFSGRFTPFHVSIQGLQVP